MKSINLNCKNCGEEDLVVDVTTMAQVSFNPDGSIDWLDYDGTELTPTGEIYCNSCGEEHSKEDIQNLIAQIPTIDVGDEEHSRVVNLPDESEVKSDLSRMFKA